MPPTDRSVLVVDDEFGIRELLTEVLTNEGYRVSTAKDGREALDCTVFKVPDLVLSDIAMPRMHGLTLVKCLRDEGHTMPIILMSGGTPDPGLPGVQFIEKPFSLDDVVEAVAHDLPLPVASASPADGKRSR